MEASTGKERVATGIAEGGGEPERKGNQKSKLYKRMRKTGRGSGNPKSMESGSDYGVNEKSKTKVENVKEVKSMD